MLHLAGCCRCDGWIRDRFAGCIRDRLACVENRVGTWTPIRPSSLSAGRPPIQASSASRSNLRHAQCVSVFSSLDTGHRPLTSPAQAGISDPKKAKEQVQARDSTRSHSLRCAFCSKSHCVICRYAPRRGMRTKGFLGMPERWGV